MEQFPHDFQLMSVDEIFRAIDRGETWLTPESVSMFEALQDCLVTEAEVKA